MVDQGLNASVEDCLNMHQQEVSARPRRSVFSTIIETFNGKSDQNEKIMNAGQKAFYDRKVIEPLDLTPGSEDVLKKASQFADVHLVTSGIESTQFQKIEKLNIGNFFNSITIVNTLDGESKLTAFANLLSDYNYRPEEVLVVGDRRDQEIFAGKTLGLKTCLIKYGEYRTLQPNCVEEIADYEVEDMTEMVQLCLVQP